MTFTTRFAPSPTGPLHLGHAYSALLAHDMARAAGGRFLLRIEDIDQSRARVEWEEQIYDDLTWLGLTWDGPVLRQSDRIAHYGAALDRLWDQGLLFACTCTRKDIQAALSAPQEGAPMGPDGVIYPGTCRARPAPATRPSEAHIRLKMNRAADALGLGNDTDCVTFHEDGRGDQGQHGEIRITRTDLVDRIGDVVLARREFGTSYHLSVVLDDAAQEVTHVVRGQDLFSATAIHVVLQKLLGLETPVYHHHRLIRDDQGKRLAKRDDARAIARYRAEGARPEDIRAMVGL
ncbi:tRNA glutamyl-Q(34) synthetase GluQRS [Arenibacterium sp. CAU 1754]